MLKELVPVAVNVTGLPEIPAPAAVAVRTLDPLLPGVQLPTWAMPLLSVATTPVVTWPRPVVTTKVTSTPGTGLWSASVTRTEGGVGTG